MWRYCEKNSDVIWYCESQCERNSAHIVTHIVRRLWENCERRWIPLLWPPMWEQLSLLNITMIVKLVYIKNVFTFIGFIDAPNWHTKNVKPFYKYSINKARDLKKYWIYYYYSVTLKCLINGLVQISGEAI